MHDGTPEDKSASHPASSLNPGKIALGRNSGVEVPHVVVGAHGEDFPDFGRPSMDDQARQLPQVPKSSGTQALQQGSRLSTLSTKLLGLRTLAYRIGE